MDEFKLNDKVMHCREGLSVISSLKTMCERDYFVVHSFRGDGEAIYVPIDGAGHIIRKIMPKDKAEVLLSSLKDIKLEFNTNTKQRRDAYKRRISSGEPEDIAYMFYQNYLYSENPDLVRLGPSDVEMLTYARNCFLDELALTFDVDPSEIESFLIKKIRQG